MGPPVFSRSGDNRMGGGNLLPQGGISPADSLPKKCAVQRVIQHKKTHGFWGSPINRYKGGEGYIQENIKRATVSETGFLRNSIGTGVFPRDYRDLAQKAGYLHEQYGDTMGFPLCCQQFFIDFFLRSHFFW